MSPRFIADRDAAKRAISGCLKYLDIAILGIIITMEQHQERLESASLT